MDPPRQGIQGTLSLVEALELPHPAAALLRAFILDALNCDLAADYVRSRIGSREEARRLVSDWIFIVQAISSNGVELEAPDKTAVREIVQRDGNVCCVSGMRGTFRNPLIVAPILPLPADWLKNQHRSVPILSAFFGGPYLDWWLSTIDTPQFISAQSSHWLVRQTVAGALKCGQIRLDRIRSSMVEYRVHPVSITLTDPIQLKGSMALLGDHSRAGIEKVDPRFVALRFSAYKKLMRFGNYWYGTTGASGIVTKLPFGLFLKYSANIECVRNEFNALDVVGKNTGVPVPRALDFASKWIKGNSELLPQGYYRSYLLTSELPGAALSLCMDAISDADYQRIQLQLQAYVSQIRDIPQTVNPDFVICDSRGEACRDPRIGDFTPIGPFKDEAAFSQELRFPDEPSRRGHKIVFTHADLNPRNIIVNQVKDATGTLHWEVSGIVDWEAAGYYPEYWDCTKSMFEGFRWPRRHNDTMKRVFAKFGDYSAELELETKAWESGDGV
ncbi:hypothetical protein ACQRIU_004641 [Beauveria bassiana]